MAIKHLMPFLGIMGGILGLSGLILSQIEPPRPWTVVLLEGLALLCLFVYLMGNWEQLKRFSARRSTRLGFNSILAIVLMIGILAIINFLAVRHGGRWDLSETQRFSLAPQTYQVLGNLQEDISVTVFAHERSPGFGAYRDLLESYSHATPLLSVKFVDPDKYPNIAREFNIAKLDTAVFESPTQKIYVNKPTEVNLTSALIRVTTEQKKRIVFLEGHGERSLQNQDRSGLSLIRETLLTQGYEVERGRLRGEETLLRETVVLVIAGPRELISQEELDRITHFIQSGGRALLLIDPQTTTGTESFLAQWGISLGPGILVDPEDRVAQGSPTALMARRFTDHPITKGFTAPILLPVAQPVKFDQSAAPTWKFTSLVQSSEESWAEITFSQDAPVFDRQEDIKGPFTLGAVIDQQGSDDKSGAQPGLVIIGNSAFASNTYLKFPGNTDILLNTIAWLAQENTLVSISPKDQAFEPFIPNPTQEHMLLAVQVFSVPFLILFLGISIWRRRSRL